LLEFALGARRALVQLAREAETGKLFRGGFWPRIWKRSTEGARAARECGGCGRERGTRKVEIRNKEILDKGQARIHLNGEPCRDKKGGKDCSQTQKSEKDLRRGVKQNVGMPAPRGGSSGKRKRKNGNEKGRGVIWATLSRRGGNKGRKGGWIGL